MTSSYNKDVLKFYLILLYVIFATYLAWLANYKSFIGIDDANIYMVYMRNLADGYGFVYNIGGERVEGFTSLLWTLIGAASFYITKRPEILLLIINIFLVSYALWRLICFIDKYFHDKRLVTPYSLFILGTLILTPGYFEWTVLSLLETGLWSSILILLTLNLMDINHDESRLHHIKFYILLILLVMTRPEAILWGGLFIVARFFIFMSEEKSIKRSLQLIFPALLVFVTSIVGLILWREFYFGFPFPNTYYAKVSSDISGNIISGIIYDLKSFGNDPLSLLTLLIVIGNLYKLKNINNITERYKFIFLSGIVILTFAIPLYTGGDHFGLSRFLQPTRPLILLTLLLFLKLLKFKMNYFVSLLFIIVFSFGNRHPVYVNLVHPSPISGEWKIAKIGRELGDRFNLFFAKNSRYPSLGVIAAGGTAFSCKGITIDLLGLNNVDMAHASKIKNKGVLKNHASFNKEVFYRQKPDIIWFSGSFIPNNKDMNIKAQLNAFQANILQHINKDNRFKDTYSRVVIRNKYLDFSLIIFASNSFLNTLNKNIYSYRYIDLK